jgi:hypothetical protein
MADNVNRLLIAGEDAAVVEVVGNVAKHVGYAVASATSGARFVQLLESFQPSLIVMHLSKRGAKPCASGPMPGVSPSPKRFATMHFSLQGGLSLRA